MNFEIELIAENDMNGESGEMALCECSECGSCIIVKAVVRNEKIKEREAH
jgi:hypothetical protein